MITKLALQNFRNFTEKNIAFGNQTVIVGKNGSGKTNILESLYLLSTGKSLRSFKQEEMILFGAEIARVKGKFKSESESVVLECVLTKGILEQNGMVEKIPKKKMLIDGVSRRVVDFASHFKTVTFVPQDMDLIIASPSKRREFLDTVLSQADREYHRSLLSYEKGLRSRNKLLQYIREFGGNRNTLYFWDKLILKNGDYIANKREQFIDFMNTHKTLGDNEYQVLYDRSVISEERLKQYEREEVMAGTTLVGPHRDDLVFYLLNEKAFPEGKNLAHYGSRGEQRMGVLWAKVTEIFYIEQNIGERPTLLLDDIFSELDDAHRDIVKEVITKQQTIMTTADDHYVSDFTGIDKIEL